jgi:hypothetical protein
MKSLTHQLELWLQEHAAMSDSAEATSPLKQNYHAGMACMASQVSTLLPQKWTLYQVERVRIIGSKKEVDSLGLFFDQQEAKAQLVKYQQRRERKGYSVTYSSPDGDEVELYRKNDQGVEMEVSLIITSITAQ